MSDTKLGCWLTDRDIGSMGFLKPVDRLVTMINGHLRVFFTDESYIELYYNKRRVVVLPRRKRAYARSIGVIQ